jgi:hypothetical protein
MFTLKFTDLLPKGINGFSGKLRAMPLACRHGDLTACVGTQQFINRGQMAERRVCGSRFGGSHKNILTENKEKRGNMSILAVCLKRARPTATSFHQINTNGTHRK